MGDLPNKIGQPTAAAAADKEPSFPSEPHREELTSLHIVSARCGRENLSPWRNWQ